MNATLGLFVLLMVLGACGGPAAEPENTPTPQATTWQGVIYCPECEGLPLSLWQNIDAIGTSPGKVNDGDICTVLDKGTSEGIEKYKINCDGKIGWLRAEGVRPAQ